MQESKLSSELELFLSSIWTKTNAFLKLESTEKLEFGTKFNFDYEGIKFGCYISDLNLTFFFYNEFSQGDITFWKSKYDFKLISHGLDKSIFYDADQVKPEVIMNRYIHSLSILKHDCRYIMIMLRYWAQNPKIEELEREMYNAAISKV